MAIMGGERNPVGVTHCARQC